MIVLKRDIFLIRGKCRELRGKRSSSNKNENNKK